MRGVAFSYDSSVLFVELCLLGGCWGETRQQTASITAGSQISTKVTTMDFMIIALVYENVQIFLRDFASSWDSANLSQSSPHDLRVKNSRFVTPQLPSGHFLNMISNQHWCECFEAIHQTTYIWLEWCDITSSVTSVFIYHWQECDERELGIIWFDTWHVCLPRSSLAGELLIEGDGNSLIVTWIGRDKVL